MKKLLAALIFTSATFAAMPGFALLAPLHQSVKEIDALLSSKELFSNLKPNETIQMIKHDTNRYIVRTEDREMVVDVVELPSTGVGPKEFKLEFHTPEVYFD